MGIAVHFQNGDLGALVVGGSLHDLAVVALGDFELHGLGVQDRALDSGGFFEEIAAFGQVVHDDLAIGISSKAGLQGLIGALCIQVELSSL